MSRARDCAIFVLGAAAGAAAALIVAPQAGAKTRKQLKRNLRDAGDYLKDGSEDFGKQANRAYKKARDVAGEVASRVSSAASTMADKVTDLM